jgi:hypothetical protein
MKKELGTFLLLVVLCIVVAILNPRFLAGANLQNMARLVGAYGIFSIGLGLVIMTGGIDLSVGSVFALLGVLLSMMLTEWHWPAALAVLAVVGITTGLGALHGLLITRLNLQPFIVTLCGLLFYRGLARFIANDETKGFGNAAGFETLQRVATGSLFHVPTPFVILVIISVIMWFVLHRSIYGRYLFAVGRNEVANSVFHRELRNLLEAEEAFAKLKGTIPSLVVTHGPQGVYVRHGNVETHVPAFPCEPKDLTGAGDMLAGSFLYGITHDVPADQAARAACYLARKVITQVGARLHHGTRHAWDEGLAG